MWFCSSFDSQPGSRRHRKQRTADRKQQARRLLLEGLEDRSLLAFLPVTSYPVVDRPQAVVTADFNNDGRLDVATGNSGSSNVSVLLGNADGTFQPAQESPAGNSPSSIAVGDFNADGMLDLATVNAYSSADEPSVLLGNADGTFQAPINIGSNSVSVAVGDFNNDGKLDLAVTSNVTVFDGCGWYGCYYHDESRANVLLGNGLGSFAAPIVSYLNYEYHASAVVADFNGDGKLDIASIYRQSGTVYLALGTGTGAFVSQAGFGAGGYPYKLAAGDMNVDGKVDLVTSNPDGNTVSVLLGNGLGSLGTAQTYAAVSQPGSLGLADFNGDGKADIATANGDGSVSVLLGTGLAGASAFKSPLILAGAGSSLGQLAVGKFNADARPDLVATNPSGNSALVFLNDGLWPALNAPSITISDAPSVTEGNVGTVNVNFTVSLSAQYSQPVTVVYATADRTATAGSDYQGQTNTLTFAPGQTSKLISIAVNGDRLGEFDEYFDVKLTGSTNAFIADGSGAGKIVDDEPVVSIVDSGSGVEGNAGTTAFNFTVTLSAAYDAPVTVAYSTADLPYNYGSSAAAGVDYTATSGTLTFNPGEPLTQTITVLVTGDRVAEANELFWVNLSPLTSARVVASQCLAVIEDDEPRVSIDYGPVSVTEGNSGTTSAKFTVRLAVPYDVPVSVNLSTVEGDTDYPGGYGYYGYYYPATSGSDFQPASNALLTFAPNETEKTISIPVNGDRLAEPDEYFSVNLSSSDYGMIAASHAVGIILNDEPYASIGNATVVEGNSGTTAFTFTISLSAAPDASNASVTVNYATADGSATVAGGDYQAKTDTVSFGIGETSKQITVLVNGDRLAEYDESFYVNLTGASGAVLSYYSTGYGTIVDNEPRLSVNSPSITEGNSGTKLLTFTVTLLAAYDQAVTVHYATQDGSATAGSDYVATSGTLTFAPFQTTKTITVTIKGDKQKEYDEYFYVVLSDASSNAMISSSGIGTILNDEPGKGPTQGPGKH